MLLITSHQDVPSWYVQESIHGGLSAAEKSNVKPISLT
jgi:hypothetical protein